MQQLEAGIRCTRHLTNEEEGSRAQLLIIVVLLLLGSGSGSEKWSDEHSRDERELEGDEKRRGRGGERVSERMRRAHRAQHSSERRGER